MTSDSKARCLLVGCGGVGTMAAYNIELGGKATVTAVLRSNFTAVERDGFSIDSIDHGKVEGWRPTEIRTTIPDIKTDKDSQPYDFIIVTTKNTPDIPPSLPSLIAPAVTPGHTSIMLLQNGLNIEKPFFAAFPENPILSGVSLIGATETAPGKVLHDDRDRMIVGAFPRPISSSTSSSPPEPTPKDHASASHFVDIYSASGNVVCDLTQNVGLVRWRKLVYNASYNSICAITGLDTTRMRFAGEPLRQLIRPAMWEIIATARAAGYALPQEEEIVETMVDVDPWSFFKPSMLQDVEKNNFTEFENIVGEPVREAQRLGVPTPTLQVIYALLQTMQWKTKESRGLFTVPSERPEGFVLAK
ncbi:hypothetical protein Plec18167_007722 [Paecilomyces lecythidis]|uniref:2-dehydropantoate 2-reductase n=1 Tax=Paecilomyces lecythidis TaxID=3004212 RepID=A0ABR3X252_9EURO